MSDFKDIVDLFKNFEYLENIYSYRINLVQDARTTPVDKYLIDKSELIFNLVNDLNIYNNTFGLIGKLIGNELEKEQCNNLVVTIIERFNNNEKYLLGFEIIKLSKILYDIVMRL